MDTFNGWWAAGKGVISQGLKRMLRPGAWTSKPTASAEFEGASLWVQGEGASFCAPNGSGGYEWITLSRTGAAGFDARYVNVAGDTMTGQLTISNDAVITGFLEVDNGLAVFAASSLDGALVINESGAAVNTRIESDTNANAILVDGTNNRVGILNASPAVALDVTGEARVSTAGTNAASVVTVGGTQTLTSKTLTTPTIADHTNATHNHSNAAGGGTIASTSITGMAWTYINTASPSGVSTSSMDSLFSSTYNHYLILFRFSMSASATAFNFRFRAASADDANANYANQHQLISSGAASITNNTGQTSGLLIGSGGVGITWTDIAGFMHLYNPQDADETVWEGHLGARFSTPGASQASPAGYFNNTTAFTGFSFIPASGNITGTWVVYGARDS